MQLDKHNFQNESHIQKKIRLLLYPVIFSLLMTLSAYAQTKDSKNILDQKNAKQTEIVTDSIFLDNFEKIFNQLTNSELPMSLRTSLEKKIVLGLGFYFDVPDDTLNAVKQEQVYMKRKGDAVPKKLEWFLENFYKESYRSAGTLSVKILSISRHEDNKIYIEYDYLYTPKIKGNPEK